MLEHMMNSSLIINGVHLYATKRQVCRSKNDLQRKRLTPPDDLESRNSFIRAAEQNDVSIAR